MTLRVRALVAVPLLLALLFVPVQAIVASAGASTRAFPKKADNERLPPFFVRPFDDALFGWSIRYDDVTRTELLIGTFNFTVDQWVAVGINSPKKMDGPITSCWFSDDGTSVYCDDYQGNYYDLARVDRDYSWPIAAGTVNGNAFIQFATIVGINVGPPVNTSNVATYYSNSTARIPTDPGDFVRVIFGSGSWTNSSRLAMKGHTTEYSTSFSINWRTGEVQSLTSKMYQYVLYEMIGIGVVILCIAFFERHYNAPRAPWRRPVYAAASALVFVACLSQFIAIRYLDYVAQVTPKPQIRCFGDGMVFLFAFLMVPTAKRVIFSNMFSVSHERAIKYHAFIAWLIVLCGAIHGLGMFYYYGSGCLTWKNKDEQSRLPGLIAYLLILATVIPAALRHHFWNQFRMAHYTYVLVFFFSVLHFPPTIYALIPGGVLQLFALAVKQLVVTQGVAENLDVVSYDEKAGVVIVDIARNDFFVAGSWFTLCFPELNRFDFHPFSVAKALPVDSGRTTVMRFYIKVTNNPTGWTKRLADWITKVQSNDPADGQVFKVIRCNGPLGMFEVNPKHYRHILLIAGGIGITQHLLILQQFLISDSTSIGEIHGKLSISLIWAVREPALMELFMTDLYGLKQRIEQLHKHVMFNCHVFVTCPAEPDYVAQLAPNPYLSLMGVTKHQRPTFDAELDAITKRLEVHVEMWSPRLRQIARVMKGLEPIENIRHAYDPLAEPTTTPENEFVKVLNSCVATYVSGPKAFMDAVRPKLKETKNGFEFHCHYDTYAL